MSALTKFLSLGHGWANVLAHGSTFDWRACPVLAGCRVFGENNINKNVQD